jgi:hypothetical protein
MDLGGFVGEARYAGNLDDFLPLLLIGEVERRSKAAYDETLGVAGR